MLEVIGKQHPLYVLVNKFSDKEWVSVFALHFTVYQDELFVGNYLEELFCIIVNPETMCLRDIHWFVDEFQTYSTFADLLRTSTTKKKARIVGVVIK